MFLYYFFVCGHCIFLWIPRNWETQDIHLIFVGIVVFGRFGCVIVFFRRGQLGNAIVLFIFRWAGRAMSLYYLFSVWSGWVGPLYYFHLVPLK